MAKKHVLREQKNVPKAKKIKNDGLNKALGHVFPIFDDTSVFFGGGGDKNTWDI